MMVASVTTTAASGAAVKAKTSLSDLNQNDFLKLMMAQLKQQDPTAPTDQKEMLAQMAQFSSLAGSTEMGETLKTISSQLDTLAAAQEATAKAVAALAVAQTKTV